MKINAEQLDTYLQKLSKQGQGPRIFLLSGDEPFQKMEAADAIRGYASQVGYSERELLHADQSFNWNELLGASNSLSLFSEKKLIDLRVETKTPGKAGSQAIRDYANNPPDDKILLIQTPKLAAAARNAAWVKAIDKLGAVINIWELSTAQTMGWVSKRMRLMGMRATPDAVRLLTERVEGNLLAAYQEINKLKLLFHTDNQTETLIDEQQVLTSVSDSSRFSIFDLSNAVMNGDSSRIHHIHHSLREEGVPIQLILWTLSDLSRQLYSAHFHINNGVSQSQVMAKIPRPRQRPFQQALQRTKQTNFMPILHKNSEIDRLSKGQGDTANKGTNRVWSELLAFALMISGVELLSQEA